MLDVWMTAILGFGLGLAVLVVVYCFFPNFRFLTFLSPLVVATYTSLWWKGGLRLFVYRLFFRIFGPTCQLRVTVEFQVNPEKDDKAILDEVYKTVRLWDKEARSVRVPNQIVLTGDRTVTATVTAREDEDYDHLDDNEIWSIEEDEERSEVPVRKDMSIDIQGFEGRLTQMDDAISGEVLTVCERLSGMGIVIKPAFYYIRATVKKQNPFFMFYFRDVPSSAINDFDLSFTETIGGIVMNVRIISNKITVSSNDMSALTRVSKRYLASPALSDRD